MSDAALRCFTICSGRKSQELKLFEQTLCVCQEKLFVALAAFMVELLLCLSLLIIVGRLVLMVAEPPSFFQLLV